MLRDIKRFWANNIYPFFTVSQRLDEVIAWNRKLDDLLADRGSIQLRLASIERKIERLEIFSHGARATYVGNNRVLMKAIIADHQIAFLVEANDRLLAPWFIITGGYEIALTNYFVRALKADSHCLDIGSNFGFFTCLMARFCPDGRVIGVEPDRQVFELARDNTLINGFGHAEVLNAAASKEHGEMTLYRRLTRSGNTSIAKLPADFIAKLGEQPSEPFTVESICIDDLISKMDDRIDFVKIDVEGAEPLVLQGAAATISKNPNITIVMEWSPGQITQAGFGLPRFIENLKDMGLKAFDIAQDGSLIPISFDDLMQSSYLTGIALKHSA
ncbi:MAG: FkbM family methyltransferase [Beijerinckiaceae bacterium]|nr:MAG: FkbM family methyltransferase [Beijerinckiaceae bacterium]